MAKSNEEMRLQRLYMMERKPKAMVHDDYHAGFQAGRMVGRKEGDEACLSRLLDFLTMPLEDLQKDAADKAATLSAAGELTPNLKVLPIFYLEKGAPVNG